MIKFNPHGQFEITVEGKILKITADYSWNRQCADEFMSVIYDVVNNQIEIKPFGTLCVLGEEWLPTSDSLSVFPIITKWGIENGMKKEAFVFKTIIAESLLLENLLSPFQGNECEFKTFKSESEAIHWLNEAI